MSRLNSAERHVYKNEKEGDVEKEVTATRSLLCGVGPCGAVVKFRHSEPTARARLTRQTSPMQAASRPWCKVTLHSTCGTTLFDAFANSHPRRPPSFFSPFLPSPKPPPSPSTTSTTSPSPQHETNHSSPLDSRLIAFYSLFLLSSSTHASIARPTSPR